MLEKYIKTEIDIEGLLKDLNLHEATMEEWQKQLEEITELPRISDEAIRSTEISDLTANIAIRRETLNSKIKSLENDINAVCRAVTSLPTEEQQVVKMIYFSGKHIQSVCEQLKYEKSKIYEIRQKALNRLKLLLYGE